MDKETLERLRLYEQFLVQEVQKARGEAEELEARVKGSSEEPSAFNQALLSGSRGALIARQLAYTSAKTQLYQRFPELPEQIGEGK